MYLLLLSVIPVISTTRNFVQFAHWLTPSAWNTSWSEVKAAQPCPTLCNPMNYTFHGILQARILEWVAFSFSRGIFPIQGLNSGLPHCRLILYQLNHKGCPRNTAWHIFTIPRTVAHHTPMCMGFPGQEYWWVALSFSRGSSQPNDWTRVSCASGIAGRSFTCWVIREAHQ